LFFIEVHIMRKYAVPLVIAFATLTLIVAFIAPRRSQLNQEPPAMPQTENVAVARDEVAAAPAPIALKANVARSAASGAGPATSMHAGHSAAAPQIARTGRIDLLVGDAQTAVATLAGVARHGGGDVFSLQLAGASDASPASAVMQLRVPADRFDVTMDAVTRAGRVRQQSESASDMTGDIADSDAQLRNLRRTEDDLRKIMDRSGSVEQILDVENQLSQVREQIETLESSLKTMRRQVVYSTIDVTLSAETSVSPVTPAAGAQLANAFRSAVHAFGESGIAILSALLWLIVFAPYFAIIAAIAWLAARRLRPARP
jgi:hypothetical protein